MASETDTGDQAVATDEVARLRRALDAHLHEIVAAAPAEDVAPGTVVREIGRGWQIGVEVLRPAQMVVATPGEAA